MSHRMSLGSSKRVHLLCVAEGTHCSMVLDTQKVSNIYLLNEYDVVDRGFLEVLELSSSHFGWGWVLFPL